MGGGARLAARQCCRLMYRGMRYISVVYGEISPGGLSRDVSRALRRFGARAGFARPVPALWKLCKLDSKRKTEAQVLQNLALRAGTVQKDKRAGKIYQKGKAPVLMSEEERLPAVKKAKKSA